MQVVAFNLTEVRTHFRENTPMAYALRAGLALYDPERMHACWQEVRLGAPKREWIERTFSFMMSRLEWGVESYRHESAMHRRFCRGRGDCGCAVSDVLIRSVLNLLRLLLVLRGYVPMSKAHVRQIYPRIVRGSRLRRAVETALAAHHEDRFVTIPEAREIVHLATWVKKQLTPLLGSLDLTGARHEVSSSGG
jgi:hypothetical protein